MLNYQLYNYALHNLHNTITGIIIIITISVGSESDDQDNPGHSVYFFAGSSGSHP